ncbi:thioredoxin family protein [bacterium]|nr:thioredoxin family protein [bacterium]
MLVTIYSPAGRHAEVIRDATKRMLKDMGVKGNVKVETDEFSFTRAGVMFTPAVSINGTLISNGWVPEPSDMAEALSGGRY